MSKSYSPSKEKMTSHGRGGAGNIASSSSTPKPEDLATPTIKTETYTTGRGGAGNMAKNDPSNPELARESQDVTAPVRTVSPEQSHYGRGGAANTVKLKPEENETRELEAKSWERTGSVSGGVIEEVKGLADKGKELLTGKS